MDNQAETDSDETAKRASNTTPPGAAEESQEPSTVTDEPDPEKNSRPVEIGGPSGLEPTRYGDWERKGRCVDF